MSNSKSEELINAESLMYKGRFEDALEILTKFEEREGISSKDQLALLILKGRIYCNNGFFKRAIEFGDHAYLMSQKHKEGPEYLDALIIKAHIIFLGNFKKGHELVLEAEKIFDSITNKSYPDFLRLKLELFLIKTHEYCLQDDLDKALDLALECLEIGKQIGKILDLARIYFEIGYIYVYKGEHDSALEYAIKSLNSQEKLSNQVGIATSLSLIGLIYYVKGDFNRALKLSKKSLLIKEINILTKIEVLNTIGAVYKNRGELDRALRYNNRSVILAEKEGYTNELALNLLSIGNTYRMKGDFNKALESVERCLAFSEKFGFPYGILSSLLHLVLINLDKNNLERAKQYLGKLEIVTNKTESKAFTQAYQIAKALVWKKSGRIRYLTDAEKLLNKIISTDIAAPILYHLSIINLCELYLEELNITNNQEVLDDLDPLISKMLLAAERHHSYLWLAETKLLQAKLALIQMKIDDTKKLLTQAQRIAELNGLNLLALKISEEHDKLLEQVSVWEKLKEENAPMSERIKLASFDGLFDRMEGKSVVKPPKLVHEVPVLLLIIGEGGFPLFSNQFSKKWAFEEDLLSSFLTAFNTFSGEFFSKGLDRAKFGEYTILLRTVNTFSVCYIFKGQTYLAKQRLRKFTEQIFNITPIWQTLNKFYNTSRIVELNDIPALEPLITEIFIV
ncbi:MAG: tetratricopeptide repeat protein [Promethearchaeota archaeon]